MRMEIPFPFHKETTEKLHALIRLILMPTRGFSKGPTKSRTRIFPDCSTIWPRSGRRWPRN